MKTIFILMDSLNRKYLSCYEDTFVKTPNIERLAKRGMVFDNHYAGSVPCMPARRDIMTGRYNFLEAPWGPLEPFDITMTQVLKEQINTYSHMITDHYHYFEWYGQGYQTVFDTWEFERGQEGDWWHPLVKEPKKQKFKGKNNRQDFVNRMFMDLEDESAYPTPRCFQRAISFLDVNHDSDNWHLHLEVFDPHEPFMAPSEYREMYDDVWEKEYMFDWPNYEPVNEDDSQEEILHIRKQYAATVTMADAWLGKLLDRMDKYQMWDDTCIILTSDHGHLLGEHGYYAKNYMFQYKQLVNIPLIVYLPGAKNNKKHVKALTSNIDIMPTILELYEADIPKTVLGKSFKKAFDEDTKHQDYVLYGYFAKDINITDGRYTFTMQPKENSFAYYHTANPVYYRRDKEKFKSYECGKFLDWTDFLVYRIKWPSVKHHNAKQGSLLYDTLKDKNQEWPIRDEGLIEEYTNKLFEYMKKYQAPENEFERIGL